MRSLIPAVLIVTGAIVSSSVAANAEQLMGASNVPPAPVGHFQPRSEDFSPGAQANQAEQERLSKFDAQQQKLDETLDRKLNICRC
jgi:hypothetical protein